MNEYVAERRLMGSSFQFIIKADTESEGRYLLDESIAEVQRIEKLLTEFDEQSETSLINRHAGICPVQVSMETYQLIQRCINISRLTRGTFDISTGNLKRLYQFKNTTFEMPSQQKIADCLATTGYEKIKLLPDRHVFLEVKGMRIGFGAIGKGYAADKVKKGMQQKGAVGGVINASGDLSGWGTKQDGSPWKAGIANPDTPQRILQWFPLNGSSIATSGNYEQYFDWKGTRYSHNIDPRSGLPVTGIRSVSVVSPSAELSDALATAVTVMGIHRGLRFVNQLPQTHCILIDHNNQLHFSDRVERMQYFESIAQ